MKRGTLFCEWNFFIRVMLSRYFSRGFGLLIIQRERLGILGIGLLGNQFIAYGFNWVLYPFVIWKFGLIFGFFIMSFLSFLVCYGLVLFYDWSKRDWLGIEMIKELREYSGNATFGKIFSWIMNRGGLVALIFLSIKFDPFIATVYMRKGAGKFDGMKRRDWTIFFSSLVIGGIYWAILVFTGISGFKYILLLSKM